MRRARRTRKEWGGPLEGKDDAVTGTDHAAADTTSNGLQLLLPAACGARPASVRKQLQLA